MIKLLKWGLPALVVCCAVALGLFLGFRHLMWSSGDEGGSGSIFVYASQDAKRYCGPLSQTLLEEGSLGIIQNFMEFEAVFDHDDAYPRGDELYGYGLAFVVEGTLYTAAHVVDPLEFPSWYKEAQKAGKKVTGMTFRRFARFFPLLDIRAMDQEESPAIPLGVFTRREEMDVATLPMEISGSLFSAANPDDIPSLARLCIFRVDTGAGKVIVGMAVSLDRQNNLRQLERLRQYLQPAGSEFSKPLRLTEESAFAYLVLKPQSIGPGGSGSPVFIVRNDGGYDLAGIQFAEASYEEDVSVGYAHFFSAIQER